MEEEEILKGEYNKEGRIIHFLRGNQSTWEGEAETVFYFQVVG